MTNRTRNEIIFSGDQSYNKYLQLKEEVANNVTKKVTDDVANNVSDNIENKMKKEIKSVEDKIQKNVKKEVEKKYLESQDPVKQNIRTKLEFGAVLIGAIIFAVALAWNEVIKTVINNATSSYQNKVIKVVIYAAAVTLIAYIIVHAYNQYLDSSRGRASDEIDL